MGKGFSHHRIQTSFGDLTPEDSESVYSHPSRDEVKTGWSFTSIPQCIFWAWYSSDSCFFYKL